MLRWKSSLKPAAASGDNPGTTNLVGNWSMDETSGTRADSHGSNDLTDNNTVGYATGVISNAASFIRANTESLSSSTQPITGTGARAEEFWFKTSSSEDMAFVSYGINVNGKWWRIRMENGAIWQRVTGGAKEWTNTWNDGNWHHLVMQVDANSTIDDVVLYIDGTLQSSSGASTTRALDTGSANFYIGRESSGSVWLDGDIDEYRHWNRVLAANEIAWLYNSGSGRSYSDLSGGGGTSPGTTNLLAWYEMNDASGGAVDSHSGSYDLTENGTPLYAQTGVNGNAIDFDGSTDYFSLASTFGWSEAYPFSFSAHFKTSSASTQTISQMTAPGAQGKYVLMTVQADGEVSAYVRNGTIQSITSSGAGVGDGAWHHLVATFVSATERYLYLDGVQVAGSASETSQAIDTAMSEIRVGADQSNGVSSYFEDY